MDKAQIRETIARRAAKELHDGYVAKAKARTPKEGVAAFMAKRAPVFTDR